MMPATMAQQVRMRLQVLFVRNSAAAGPELDHVQRVQRQPRQICQTFGKGRFSAAGVSEYRDSLHLARSVNMSPRRALRVRIDEHRQA